MDVIALHAPQADATATAWIEQGDALTASGRALGDIVQAAGFTDHVRPTAAAAARAWAGCTAALADRCRGQGTALRTTASALLAADEAARSELGPLGPA